MNTNKIYNRKTILSISSLLILFISIMCLSGCFFTLATPEITRNGSIISWDRVDNAGSYEILLSNEEESLTLTTTANQFDLAAYLTAGKWTVSVKAVSNSFIRNDSAHSRTITFSVSSELETPENIEIIENNGQIFITFDAVIGADNYGVSVRKSGSSEILQSFTVQNSTSPEVEITSAFSGAGSYVIAVNAASSSYAGEIGVFVSDTNEYEYVYTYELETPTITSFAKVGNEYVLTWSRVNGATSYVVSLLGTDKTLTTTSTSMNVANIEGGLPAIVSVDGTPSSTAFIVAFVQAVSDDEYIEDSDFSLGKAYYGYTGSQNLGLIKIDNFYSDFQGTDTFDFCADSQEELNTIIFYTIYYRLSDITVYQNFTSTNALSTAFANYPEIMYLQRTGGLTGGYMNIELNYITPSTPTHIALEDYDGNDQVVTQADFGELSSYSDTPRSDDASYFMEDLPVYERTQTMNVYTSEQLFMAVQAGYLPIIVGDCGALDVWNRACQINMEILDDSMTDYEKVLAIFEWLCYNNTYDYNLLSFSDRQTELVNDYYNSRTQTWTNAQAEQEYEEIDLELRNFRGFYLEGMLFDDGRAVCDGIAKTFALLCGIEDIECYKVNGTANGGGHAWNKVFLDLDNNGTKECYVVDGTWNDYSLGSTYNRTEYLTHNYFLVTDISIRANHTETWPNKDTASTNFDYYTYTTIDIDGTEYDLYINENVTEMNNLLNYLTANYDNFNIKVTSSLYSALTRWLDTTGWLYVTVDSTGSWAQDYMLSVYKQNYTT